LEEEEVSYTWKRSVSNVASAATSDVFKAASVPRVEVETSPIAASSTPYVVKDLVPVMPADQTNKKDKDVTVEERESSGIGRHLVKALNRSEVKPSVRLMTYDGQEARLNAGPLCFSLPGHEKTTRPPEWFVRWMEGRSSTKVFGLAAQDWLQGELGAMEDQGERGRLLSPSKALLAGLFGDPSLRNVPRGLQLDQLVSPTMACGTALHELLNVLETNPDDDGQELLVSQVEVALGRLEPGRSASRDEFLKASLRREFLRYLWCSESFESSSGTLDDAWLLLQLSNPNVTPGSTDFTVLRRENAFLDRYLVRLMKLKRSLCSLLETWEKVDHYKVLGVSSSVSDKELRNAYRKACLRLHPDKGGDKLQFQQLQESYARILEERKHAQHPPGDALRPTSSTQKSSKASSKIVALDALEGEVCPSEDAPEGTGEVQKCMEHFKDLAQDMRKLLDDAIAADQKLQELRESKKAGGGLQSLAEAQEAGEMMLELSQKIGTSSAVVSEATMDVAETSLALAASFTTVPCALLLTDVALSMTLEASRVQHTGKALLEVQRETSQTLQTLQQNLSMAKILGTVDAETLKLSLNLVSKATSRIMNGVKEVQRALTDAMRRGHHCLIHATSVCRFASRENPAGASTEEVEASRALPAPMGEEEASFPTAEAENNATTSPPTATQPAPQPAPPPVSPPVGSAAVSNPELDRRRQNHQLLRQLNGELKELQKRAKMKMEDGDDVDVSDFVHELLFTATEDLLADSMGTTWHPQVLRARLAQHFHFVEVCGQMDLAMPSELPAQLLRFCVFCDSQAVLQGLEQAKRHILAAVKHEEGQGSTTPAPTAAVEQHFELLSAAVINARLI